MTRPTSTPRPRRRDLDLYPATAAPDLSLPGLPVKPLASLKYLLQSWNPLALRALMLGFAILTP